LPSIEFVGGKLKQEKLTMSLDVRLVKTDGIILRRSDCGEADRVLVVFTQNRGKIRALAKGARKLGSKKVGHLEPFASSRLMLAEKTSGFWMIRQAETTNPRGDMRTSLIRIAYASLVSEIADRITTEDGPNPNLYALLEETMDNIESDPNPEMALLVFVVRALKASGFDPQLKNCVKCGAEIHPDDHFFSPAGGGVACKSCGVHDQYARAIKMETLKYLRHIQRTPFSRLKNITVPLQLAVSIEGHLFAFLENLFEGHLRSVSFLKDVRGY
jgi:DNA repair protein RecO (recombination protein O)